jgi:hypothetical protein
MVIRGTRSDGGITGVESGVVTGVGVESTAEEGALGAQLTRANIISEAAIKQARLMLAPFISASYVIVPLPELKSPALESAALALPYGAHGDADTTQAHVPADFFESKAVGGFFAFSGAVELVAVNVYIPELAVGGSCRAGCHAQVAFTATASIDWWIQGF